MPENDTVQPIDSENEEPQSFYRDLVEASQDLIWQCDAEGRYIYLNPAWEKVFGYSHEEMIGKKFTDFQTPDQAEKDMAEFRRLLDGSMVKGLRSVHIGNNNRELHLVFNAVFIRDEAGNICGTRGTAHDITAAIEAEQKIAEQQFFLQKAQEIGRIGHFSYDPVTGAMDGSDELYRIFDIDRNMPLLEAFSTTVHSEDAPLLFNSIERAAKDGTPYTIEHRILHRDGTVVQVQSRGEIIDTPRGRRMVGVVHDLTDQKKILEKLRESRERYRTIFDGAAEGLLIADTETMQFRYSNPAIRSMLGYNERELEELSVRDIHPSDVIDDVLAAFQAGTRGEIRTLPTLPCKRKNGSIFHASITTSFVQIKGRTYLVGFFSDVTERRKSEQALRASEERLRSVIDAAPYGAHLYELDADGRLVFSGYNHSADRILGVKHAQFVGKTIDEAFPPLATTEIPERYASVARDGGSFETEQVEYEHGGIKGAFEVHAVQTGPERMAAFFRDITEYRKAELALRESERKFKAIFNSSFQFVGLLTPDGILTETNDSALRFAGITHEESIGKPLWETRWWNGNTSRMEQLKDAIRRCARGEFVRYEIEMQGKGTTTALVDFSLKPVFDADGAVSMLVPEGRDITELKNTESLLINAQRLESLGILAGGIAHDFNNLLTGIFGSVELAALDTKEESTASYLSTARVAMDRARDLTRQLLTFAKGGAPVKKVEQMAPFLEETVRFALSGSNISIRFDLPEEVWPCTIDRNQIGQVIDNIVINADQSMPAGGTIAIVARNIHLSPGQHPALRQGNYVKMSIVDRGIGIPKEILSKIFDPFFTTKSKGHGLGLAMCYSIVKRHFGVIDVESEPGKGSIFTVYLPALPGEDTVEKVDAGISYKGKGPVLVMDDDELILNTVGAMLKLLGHRVECVNDGEEALARISRTDGTPDAYVAVILDLTVPGGMGGRETVDGIRRFNRELPVFVASGYNEDPVLANPREYGFTASLRKPFLVAELAALLQQYLSS
ncbi:MAG: PAS domain S-box protein [Chitinispirillaceae bacterium]|nr:PAS domain S-box protein [Chitinispirillaceae bacterium]